MTDDEWDELISKSKIVSHHKVLAVRDSGRLQLLLKYHDMIDGDPASDWQQVIDTFYKNCNETLRITSKPFIDVTADEVIWIPGVVGSPEGNTKAYRIFRKEARN